MSTARFDTVVFDLGGVLVDWNPRYLYRQLFDDEATMERFLAEVCTSRWNERQDEGRSWAEAIAELSATYPQHAALIAAYRERWYDMLSGPIAASVSVLDELRQRGVPLYALTNWSQETFPLARQRFGFMDAFIDIMVSGEERLIKPDPVIFQRMLQRFGLNAGRTIYIDDAPRNVEAAARLDMHALQFRDAATLRDELCRAGMLDPADG